MIYMPAFDLLPFVHTFVLITLPYVNDFLLFLRGKPLQVVLLELAAGVNARTTMSNHPVAARWTGMYSLPLPPLLCHHAQTCNIS
jgi:hypothetical protein